MKLDFAEIKDWQMFEDMVAAYFEQVKLEDNNVTEVLVEQTGNGPDGGRDILVTFNVNDSITPFSRKWIIQCKFYEGIVKERELSSINIPGKIHEYGADGFLLVVKGRVHSNVTRQFENLRKNCKLNYSYSIWNGSTLKNRIIGKSSVVELFFPEYHQYTTEREAQKLEGVL